MQHAMLALGMSRNWSKKGYRPSYQHASEGGDGESKPDVNSKTIIDLSDEPEARRRRVKTTTSKEAETQQDQESGNGGGKGKQVVEPIVEAGLGKKVAAEGWMENDGAGTYQVTCETIGWIGIWVSSASMATKTGGRQTCPAKEDGKGYWTGLERDGVTVRAGERMAEVEGVEEAIDKSKGTILERRN
ncbi:hypothetical protein L1987_34274 [Smallanthus sonchifolius]|uniref:Uncharacterized protein n=1 Tax=Smallanthus sonchifolius TaxID=185202 RepID=A0ACB9HUV4_9ASTR|nr:hypothetical protein L1987_34274 [Smallanthus sonchifolius]